MTTKAQKFTDAGGKLMATAAMLEAGKLEAKPRWLVSCDRIPFKITIPAGGPGVPRRTVRMDDINQAADGRWYAWAGSLGSEGVHIIASSLHGLLRKLALSEAY